MLSKFKKLKKLRDPEKGKGRSQEKLTREKEEIKGEIKSDIHIVAWFIILFIATPLILSCFGLAERSVSIFTTQSSIAAYAVKRYIENGWTGLMMILSISLALLTPFYFF